jgi:hypothetical protein
MFRLVFLFLLSAGILVAAFHRRSHRNDRARAAVDRSVNVREAGVTFRDSAPPLGPGDVRIQNSDSSVQIAIVGNKVVGGLSPKTLDKVRRGTDTSAVSGNGLGATIERAVKSSVQSALSKQVEYPVAEINDVRYENGKLTFYWKDGKKMRLLENTHVDNHPVLETFRPDEANRFIQAFHARKSRGP